MLVDPAPAADSDGTFGDEVSGRKYGYNEPRNHILFDEDRSCKWVR